MKRNIQLTSLKVFLLAFAGLSTFSAILVLAYTPGVMVNDDIVMMAFANGDFTGNPEFQLVFIGVFIGVLLKFLYSLTPSLPWYALGFVFIQIFAGSVLLTAAFNFLKGQMNRTFIAFIGLITVLTPALVLDLSFSTTAMYASVTGITSLVIVLQGYEKQGTLITIAIGLILVLASSLRFEFFLAAALLIFPIHLLGVKKFTKPSILLALGLLFLPVGSHFIEDQISNQNHWVNYNKFNQLRGSMHGTPSFSQFVSTAYESETITKIREFGWESEDLRLFASWYFEDAQLYSTTSLEKLKQNVSTTSTTLPFQQSLEGIFNGREFLILVGLVSVVFGSVLSVFRYRNFVFFQSAWFLTVALLVSSRTRFPDRFALSAIFGFFVSLLASNMILAYRQHLLEDKSLFRIKKNEAFAFVGLILATVFLIPHKFSAEQISNQNKIEANRLTSELGIFDEIDSKGTFVHIGGLAIEGTNPWFEKTVFDGNRLLSLGWNSQSPHQVKRKSAVGLNGNFLSNFVDAPNLYLVSTEDVSKLLQHSFEKRQKTKISFINLGSLTYVNIYKVKSLNEKWDLIERDSDLDD